MSRAKKIGAGVAVFLLVAMAAITALVTTTPGLHLLLNGAARWVPGLEINDVEGGWRNLTLKGVRYQMPGVTVTAGEFHLALALGCLAESKVCVDALSASDAEVTVDSAALPPSAPEEPSGEPVAEISAPFPLFLRQLALDNVRVTVDGTAVSLGELSTGAQWEGRELTLLPTRISSLLVALPKTAAEAQENAAAEDTTPETPLGERLQALFAKPLLPDLTAVTLPLDIRIAEIRGEQWRVTGGQNITLSSLLLRASAQQQRIRLETLAVQSPQGGIHARGDVTLSDDWPLSFTLNGVVNTLPLKGEKIRLTIDGGLREQLNVALNLSGPQRAQLALQTSLAQAELPLALTLQTEQARWPLTGEAEYQVNNLNLNLKGKATDYTLALTADMRGSALPPAALTLDGKGNERQFELGRLRLAALQGSADLSALVDWSKAVSWRGELVLAGINTARQWPDWPARVDGKIATRGSVYGGSWQIQIPELHLNGDIKQNKLTAQGSLRGNAAGQWQIPQFDLALGRNHLNVKGDLGEQWRLDADINAPALNGVLPGLAGRAMGAVKLRGTPTAPQLLADIDVTGLRWQALSVNRLTLAGDVSSERQVAGKLALRVDQLRQEGVTISSLTLNAEGDEQQHRLRLRMEGEPVAGQLALTGSLDRAQQRWRGTMNDTRFDTPAGEWRLTQALALDYLNAQRKISVGAHCWRNPNAELCVPKTIEVGPSGQAGVVLNRFDLAMLKPFLGADTALSGVFSGRADVAWQEGDALPQAKVTLAGNGVAVRQQVRGNAVPIAFDTLTLNAGLERGRASLAWLVAIRDNGRLRGDIQVSDPQGRRNLGGEVTIDNLSLALLNPALRAGEKAAGVLNANLRLGGNASQPQLFGQMALERLDIDGNWMPVDLTDGRLALSFNGMTSILQGFLKTTDGQLNLSGDAGWRQPEAWRARIAAKGEKLRITLPPTVRLDVSPDIVFEATPQLFALNGSVNIPWARITVQDMPESAVDVSSDEVLLDERRRPLAEASASVPINSNLTIRIGNDVRLDAFGLKARLQGDLKMVQDEHGLGLNGQIDIPSGRFKAYGQDLTVQKGQMVFSGPPAEPLLNIEAIRNPDNTEDDVTVGVRITGPASVPKLEIFSDPTMSQQEALSYLLRGQGLDSSGADSAMMTSMLVGLGVAQSGQVVGKIGEAFGVSNLALDTQGVGDSSQVVVSGYVLPGLQVKYGVGIFDSLATLTLRYRLMPKLYLEAVSGVDQALDVLYQFEF